MVEALRSIPRHNMDGGGSTTLAWWYPSSEDADKCKLLNSPVGNGSRRNNSRRSSSPPTERANGNNLGVAIDLPPTTHDASLYLFVDDYWIESQQGLTRIHNRARPLDQPIVWPDNPQAETDCAWGNVIRESDGRFRMWYVTMTMGHTTPVPTRSPARASGDAERTSRSALAQTPTGPPSSRCWASTRNRKMAFTGGSRNWD